MAGDRPGVLKDPWQRAAPQEQAPAVKRPPVRQPKVEVRDHDNIDADREERKSVDIGLPNYGGIVVADVDSSTEAAAKILKYCVDNLPKVERILLEYGVLVARIESQGSLPSPFYIQRADGWTLIVPDATSRDMGCLQLIQAFLKLKGAADTTKSLELYRIKPYRI